MLQVKGTKYILLYLSTSTKQLLRSTAVDAKCFSQNPSKSHEYLYNFMYLGRVIPLLDPVGSSHKLLDGGSDDLQQSEAVGSDRILPDFC